jgi:hypothetical protein
MLKIPFVLGLGVGYVLGARAGRERYDQIMTLAQRTKENPAVANAAGTVMHRGEEVFHQAKGKVAEKAPDWVPGSSSSDGGSKSDKVTVHAASSNGSVTQASPGDMPGTAPGHM